MTSVVIKYIGTRPAIVAGRYIHQGEVRRVLASQYDAAERTNPGKFEVLSDERESEQPDSQTGSPAAESGRDTDSRPVRAGSRGRSKRFVETPADNKTDDTERDDGDGDLQPAE